MMKRIWNKIVRKLLHFRLQPIRVFCLHHVCKTFDEKSMNKCDWIQIDEFKSKIQTMQQNGVEFLSLMDAYHHISNDLVRRKKYAVLTFDDGYASLKEILPWLEDNQIPVTLFINGKYLDGKSYRKNPNERYLTKKELFALTSPLVEIGSHGWEHVDASRQKNDDFVRSMQQNETLLAMHPRYIPFFAYTYGNHLLQEDELLRSHSLIPVFVSGGKNRNNYMYIDRELL